MEHVLHLDFETRSPVPLLDEGAYKYARHPETEIICMAYAEGEAEPGLWYPGEPSPEVVGGYLQRQVPGSIWAHNAGFERLILAHVLRRQCPDVSYLDPPIETFFCTAAYARSMSHPGSLDDVCRSVGLPARLRKAKRGKDLIRLLSIPPYKDDPDGALLAEMGQYCRQDVVAERAICHALLAQCGVMRQPDLKDYWVSERINDRGITIDVPLASAAVTYADAELDEIKAELAEVTGGVITSPKQHARIKAWLVARLDPEVVATRLTTPEGKLCTDRTVRADLLDQPGDMDPYTYNMLELVDAAARSSVYKFRAMVARAEDDARVRGAYMFAGAGQTGRFSSTGLQLHNFVRDTDKQPEATRDRILRRAALPDGVMDTLAHMLRPTLVAGPGKVLVGGDWSAIEAMMLPWLAGADHVLEIFRTAQRDAAAPDVYQYAAAPVFDVAPQAVNKAQRQVGKVMVLAFGYGGGAGAYAAMARSYGLPHDEDEAERLKVLWRTDNPWAVGFWDRLMDAVRDAIATPELVIHVGRVAFTFIQHSDRATRPGTLTRTRSRRVGGKVETYEVKLYGPRVRAVEGVGLLRLPSGRVLRYPQLRQETISYYTTPAHTGERIVVHEAPTAIKASLKPAAGARAWPRFRLWHGQMAENVTQAAAADVLRGCLGRLDAGEIQGMDVIGHTHDEVIGEVAAGGEERARARLAAVMATAPGWAEDLPLVAETWAGVRYGK